MEEIDKEKVKIILRALGRRYFGAETALNFGTPMEMLVSTILSAQCTDARVNMVTPRLFKRYKTVADYAAADIDELEQLIRSTGFYKNKAKSIKGAAQMILQRFRGEVPRSLDEMVQLPGVGRKTASVVLYNAYGVVEGVVVDTHVGRLARRLWLSSHKDAVKVERDLMELVPRKDWANISYWLIDHGRAVCKSAKPACSDCFLNKICPSAFSFDQKGRWVGVK
jgi:endonuclease III